MFDHPCHSFQLSEAMSANCTPRATIWLCPHLTTPFQLITTEPLLDITEGNCEIKDQKQSAIMSYYYFLLISYDVGLAR